MTHIRRRDIMDKEKKNFELDDGDAAVIIKADMTTELVVPKMDDEDEINFGENQNIFITLAIGACMGDDDFREIIQAKLNTMFETMDPPPTEPPPTEPEDAPDGPSCDGCQGCG